MIQFKKIKYKNILSVGDRFIEIGLTDSKTNLIVGGNGSGKCFYMSTPIRVRNSKTGEVICTTVGEFYESQKKLR